MAAERCESGRIGVPGEHVCWQRHRGFESHPLRHNFSGNTTRVGTRSGITDWNVEGGIPTGVLKGVCPLHGVTGAKWRRKGAGLLAGARAKPGARFRMPTLSASLRPPSPGLSQVPAGNPRRVYEKERGRVYGIFSGTTVASRSPREERFVVHPFFKWR